jgi:hypothetical protein
MYTCIQYTVILFFLHGATMVRTFLCTILQEQTEDKPTDV